MTWGRGGVERTTAAGSQRMTKGRRSYELLHGLHQEADAPSWPLGTPNTLYASPTHPHTVASFHTSASRPESAGLGKSA